MIEYEEIKPWVWRQVGGSQTLAVQVEGGKVVRVGDIPAFSLLPMTVAQRVLQRFSCCLYWPGRLARCAV